MNATLRHPTESEWDSLFWEEDSDKNIVFLDKQEINSLTAESSKLPSQDANSEVPQIKAASLVKLVERVTYEKYAGNFCVPHICQMFAFKQIFF